LDGFERQSSPVHGQDLLMVIVLSQRVSHLTEEVLLDQRFEVLISLPFSQVCWKLSFLFLLL